MSDGCDCPEIYIVGYVVIDDDVPGEFSELHGTAARSSASCSLFQWQTLPTLDLDYSLSHENNLRDLSDTGDP